MSQLLEALKKAALEKQKREATAGLSPTELHELEAFHKHDKETDVKDEETLGQSESDETADDDLSQDFLDLDVNFDKLDSEEKIAEKEEALETPEPEEALETPEPEEVLETPEPEPEPVMEQPQKSGPHPDEDRKKALRRSISELTKLTEQEEKKLKKRRVYGFIIFVIVTFLTLLGFYFFVNRELQKTSISVSPRSINTAPEMTNRFPSTVKAEEVEGLNDMQSATQQKENILETVAPEVKTLENAQVEGGGKTVKSAAPKPVESTSVAPESKPEEKGALGVRDAKPIQIQRSVDKTTELNESAFNALNKGNLEYAKRLYLQAESLSSTNTDTQLGLAAVNFREQNLSQALARYQSIINREPDNIYAHEGMMSLAAQTTTDIQFENNLSQLIHRYPQAAHLRYVEGIQHAQKRLWRSASQSFSKAVQLDGGNPNYAYNLAVSYDRLGKHDLTIQYYRKALVLGQRQHTEFDRAWVGRRITQLERR